ncbi:Acyl-CoA dehydrogenase [Gordonia malaquae]|uniref:Putative acyl-CoA dehydrogenase n=1 Tax=Gordonia malaquae NBRC 108250 TaxID=1223542 RepID=M3UI62_GORML|nr:acyl-CoA dehydrogenase family protein [Gordonia malaquae]GAC79105.1 putative acyl-CoA dehydrogenase [Gordonia malaquae NBRC 108250]SEE09870.1 Acyl-CoA dehydrogenase [Gordonia malaquae]
MDFTPTEASGDLTGLTTDIVTRLATPERTAQLEADNAPIDRDLWREIAASGLLGLAASSATAGDAAADLTTLETTAVATALGRALARVPYPQHAVAAVPLIDAHGPAELTELLVRAASGDAVLTAAVEEDLNYDLLAPATTITDGRVSGVKVNVPFASAADAFLVIAAGVDGPVAAVVTAGDGVDLVEVRSTGLAPTFTVTFASAEAVVLDGGAATAELARDLLRLGVAADQAGVVAGALDATAEYARDREQFGRKIGSFQAVAQRLADDYIDAQALALTVAQAAWLLSGSDDADAAAASDAVGTAAFWTAEAGHRVAHTTVHVHGGVGLDTSHPVHRFFLRAKQNEFTYGSAPVVLAELGGALASR